MSSEQDQERVLRKLEAFKIQGKDKRGHPVLRVLGKLFPARLVSGKVLNKYLEDEIFPKLRQGPFSVVYVHTGVQRNENIPGISTLRSIYDAIPMDVRDHHLEHVYFVHPSLQARLFLATFGRLIFGGGFYGKVKYVSRLEFLWEHVRRNEIEVPEFVYKHDEEMECRPPMLDYGLESDLPRAYCASLMDSAVSTYSTRCIA